MAKKTKVDLDDGFDDFDFDDDWGSDMPDFNPASSSGGGGKSRNPIIDDSKTVLRGMKDQAMTPAFAKELLKSGLPESFSVTLDNVDRYSRDVRDLKKEVDKELRPTMNQMGQLVRTVNKIIPNPFQAKIKKYFDEKDAKNQTDQQLSLEDAAVQQGLGDVFGEQQQADRNERKAKEIIDAIDTKDYRAKMFGMVSELRDASKQQLGYQFGVQRAYQKKTLELRIRQLVLSRQQLEITQKSAVETSELLRGIRKNTGLPEFAKEQASEQFMRLARERMFGRVQNSLSQWTQSYMQKVGKNYATAIRDQLMKVRDGASNLNMSAEMFEQQQQMMKDMGISGKDMLLEMGGGELATGLGKYMAGKLRGKIPGSAKIGNTFSLANYGLRNLPFILNKVGKNADESTLLGRLLSPLSVGHSDTGVVRAGGLNGLTGDMGNQTRQLRALEEIIPGFLSRILHSIDVLRTGDESTPRQVFSLQRGAFTTMAESRKMTRSAVLNDEDIGAQQRDVSELVKSLDPYNRMGRKGNQVLQKQFLKQARGTEMFDPLQLVNAETIPGMHRAAQVRLRQALIKRYNLIPNPKKPGQYKYNVTGGNNQVLEDDSKAFNQIRDRTKSIYNNVHGMMSGGSLEELAAEGVVKFDGKDWVIDSDYYDRRVGDYTDNATRSKRTPSGNNPPPGPGSANRGGMFGRIRSLRNSLFNGGGPGGGTGPSPVPAAGGGLGGLFDRSEESAAGAFSNRGGRNVVKAIRDQTEALLAAIDESAGHRNEILEDSLETLEDINQRLMDGITTTGGGGGGGSHRSRLRRLGSRLWQGGKRVGKAWWGASALPFKGGRWALNKLRSPLSSVAGGIGRRIRDRYNNVNLRNGINTLKTNVFVIGQQGLRMALDAAGFDEGRYINLADGKVIKSIKDITGAVFDTKTQKEVISQEEFDRGLLNSVGQKIRSGILKTVGNAANWIRDIVTSPYTIAMNAAKGAFNAAKAFLMSPPDVYVAGETSPRLKGDLFFKGFYYSGVTGKVLKHLGDIDGDVVTFDSITREKKVVLSKEDIEKGLVDAKGKPLKPFMRRLRDGLSWVKDKALNLVKSPFGALTWMKDKALGVAGGVRDWLSGAGSKAKEAGQGTFWLRRIFKLLYNQFTGQPLESDIGDALGSFGTKAAETGRRFGERFRNLWGRGREKVAGSEAAQRAKEYTDNLAARSGSWVNQLKDKAGKVKDGFKDHMAKGEKKGLGGMLMTALGFIGGGIMKVWSTIKGFKDGIFKWLPKWLFKSAAIRAGEGAADALGDLAEGGGRRGKRGLLSRGARALGRGLRKIPGGRALGAVGRGAMALGGMAMSPLGWLGRGALAVGSALLSAPAMLTVGLAVGAGILIYKGWKAYSERLDLLQQARIAQYGIRLNDKEQAGKVLALEEAVLKKTTFDGQGQPVIGALAYPELISGFGFGPEARKSTLDWVKWFERRFKPVFLRNLTELNRRKPGADLTKASNELPDGQKGEFARATKIEGDAATSPYYVQASPFQNQTCVVGTGSVEATIQAVEKEYEKAKGALDVQQRYQEAKTKARIEGQKTTAPQGSTINNVPRLNQLPAGMVKSKLDNYYGAGERATLGKITGDQAKDDIIAKNNRIDDLTTIRMKAYGLTTLDKVYVNTLLNFEKYWASFVDIAPNGQATFGGDTGTAYVLQCASFGLSRADMDARAIWDLWFQHRFLPVFLNFMAQSKKVDPNSDPFTGWMRFKADELLKIANFVNDAGSDINGTRVSVWSVDASPFPGEKAGRDPSIIQPNIDAIKMALQKDKYDESQAAARAVQEKYTGKPSGDISRKVNNALSNQAKTLMGDLAAATGNSNYRTQDVALNNYSRGAGLATSFENAGTGYGSGGGAKVELKGSAKQHAESMMKAAIAAGLNGEELALFMGQVAHESGNFIYNKEIADGSKYEGRRDLGNVQPGDGVRYKGRGWVQITGRANYAKYGKMLGLDLINHPELAEIPENAEKLALAYWMDRVRPFSAKRGGLNLINVSRAINGDVQVPNGMDDRSDKTDYWRDLINNGKDVGLSNKGAVDKPGAEVTSAGGQAVTPPIAKAADGAPGATTAGGGGQETTPTLPTSTPGSTPFNSGSASPGARTDAITMVPQANPSAEVQEHRRLNEARQRVAAATQQSAQAVTTQQAKQGIDGSDYMSRSIVAQEGTYEEMKRLVGILSKFVDGYGSNGKQAQSAGSTPPSAAENAMSNIPVRSGLADKPAMPFNTSRGSTK